MTGSSAKGRNNRIRVTVKLVKTAKAGSGPFRMIDGSNDVLVSHDPDFFRDNALETILDLFVPRSRPSRVHLAAPPGAVRRVIMGQEDLAFSSRSGRITFDLPTLADDLVTAGEMHTIIADGGVELRVEHTDIRRRAGEYADGTFPVRQHLGVLALEFALREAVRCLGIDRWAANHDLGPILIMGFDTNNPHGHRDWPPHVHMHMNLPRKGAPIGHYYMAETCLLTHSVIGYRNDPRPEFTVPPGVPFTSTGPGGKPVFTLTITGEGSLRVAAPEGEACLIVPDGDGFDCGAVLRDPGGGTTRVSVVDDLDAGILTATIGASIEHHRYDVDTGRLIESMRDDRWRDVAVAMADRAQCK